MNSDEMKDRERQFNRDWTEDSEESNWSDDEEEIYDDAPETEEALAPLPELKIPTATPPGNETEEKPSQPPSEPFFDRAAATTEAQPSPETPLTPFASGAEIEGSPWDDDEESEPLPAVTEGEFSAVEAVETEAIAPPEPETQETISVSFTSGEAEVRELNRELEPLEASAPEPPLRVDAADETPAAEESQPPSALPDVGSIFEQMAQLQAAMERMNREHLSELEARKQALQSEIEQLERRRDRIRAEMRASFAGVSQDIAIRVQGFKEYLVGSLQDLAAAAEQLELAKLEARSDAREEVRMQREARREARRPPEEAPSPRFAKQGFQEQRQQIMTLLDRYRTRPDYYGPPWQLRRTFEPIHAERVQKWFTTQGGRGAIRSMGSRLQNILIASAAMSILRSLYGERLRVLVLSNTPERLGEWRRGLQDCLGISRSDFGPTCGVVLFESPEALVQKAERFVEEKQLPLVVIDETEGQLDLALLQFPLLLAFAPDPNSMSGYSF